MTEDKQEYYFKEGCYMEEWLNSADQAEMSVARVRVLAKQTTQLHCLKDTVERYVILSGEAVVTVGSESWAVQAKSVVSIAPSTPQKIENTLDQDLVFLAICVPRFLPKNYLALDE